MGSKIPQTISHNHIKIIGSKTRKHQEHSILGRMKPPSKKTRRSMRDPPVLAIIIVLETPDMNLNIPAAICWTRKTSNKCLKNLKIG